MTSFDSPSNNLDEWISALQGKPLPTSIPATPAYREGSIIRNLVQECAQERQEIQWNKVLENARRDGLSATNSPPTNTPLPPAIPIPSRPRHLTANNQPWFLLIASVTALATGIYIFLPKTDNAPDNNGLANTMGGGGSEKQSIYVKQGQTPQAIAEKIESLFERHRVGYQRFNASGGRVQFVARIPENSPARGELEKLGVPLSALSESEDFSNFVLMPAR